MGGRLVWEELGGGVPAVEVEPLGEATEVFWMLALLFRLEPKPKLLKRELMTSTMADRVEEAGKKETEGRSRLSREREGARAGGGGENVAEEGQRCAGAFREHFLDSVLVALLAR